MKAKNILTSNLSKSSARNALNLLNVMRYYSSHSSNKFSGIRQVEQEIRSHIVIKEHPFFEYLQEQSKEGFNSRQFAIYRTNFLFRTELTTQSIVKFMIAASKKGDFKTSSEIGLNILDEIGHKDPDKSRIKLLLDSYNKHGEKVFGLIAPETLKTVSKSPLLVPEVLEYRKSKLSSFKKSYPYIVGNFIAHEIAADPMLKNFKKAFFDSYKGYYSPEEYEKLVTYFTVHDSPVDGVGIEEKHGEMALETAKRIYEENIKNMPKIRQGAMDFLSAQSNLWFGILREMEKSKEKSIPITPKPEFTLATPTHSPSNPKSESVNKPSRERE